MAPNHSSVEDSQEWLETPPLPTLQSGPSPLRLSFVWVHTRPDVRPVLCNQWVIPGSDLSMFTNCWKRVILQADLQKPRMLAEMHCSRWNFCV